MNISKEQAKKALAETLARFHVSRAHMNYVMLDDGAEIHMGHDGPYGTSSGGCISLEQVRTGHTRDGYFSLFVSIINVAHARARDLAKESNEP